MGVNKEYIITSCKDKREVYGMEICMLQTEPCKVAVKNNRCPRVWEWERMFKRQEQENE